jgi:hypothetical protein
VTARQLQQSKCFAHKIDLSGQCVFVSSL